ncbi:MAG: hypothetical protein D6692_04210 [Planctomycetota bacterium]|nr:MAG: hypothetical protein D6692_04210 [Planctomycetota bacterium]
MAHHHTTRTDWNARLDRFDRVITARHAAAAVPTLRLLGGRAWLTRAGIALSEPELIEPSRSFDFGPGSADRMANAIERACAAPVRSLNPADASS